MSLVVWLQGMLNGSADVIVNESSLLLLWKHECTRVFADRFTAQDDKDWFEKTIKMVRRLFRKPYTRCTKIGYTKLS